MQYFSISNKSQLPVIDGIDNIIMGIIMPIKDLRNTTEISNIAHKEQAIFESEQEIANGAEAVDAEIVFAELEKKHFG